MDRKLSHPSILGVTSLCFCTGSYAAAARAGTADFNFCHDLDLEFSKSNMEFAIYMYLSQKWSNCHETKSKHIDKTLVIALHMKPLKY